VVAPVKLEFHAHWMSYLFSLPVRETVNELWVESGAQLAVTVGDVHATIVIAKTTTKTVETNLLFMLFSFLGS
jgi:hypothetical protein